MVVTGLRGFIEVMMHAIWLLFVVALSHMFEGSVNVVISTAHMHCAAPVMWGNVRPWATMLGSNVLLWFEA